MKLFAIAFAAALLAAGPACADDCRLDQLASLDIVTLAGGQIAVPVKIEGHEKLLVVALSHLHSALFGAVLDALDSPNRELPGGATLNGSTNFATIQNFEMGNVLTHNVKVLWKDDDDIGQANVAGYLGTDILANFDVELDLGHGKLNLFAPHPCPGQAVYWYDSAAVIPFQIDPAGGLDVAAQLDGKALTANVTTSPGFGNIDASAPAALGIDMDPAKRVPLPPLGALGIKRWSYFFKSLDFGGVAIANPRLDLAESVRIEGMVCDNKPHHFKGMIVKCAKPPDLQLSLMELRALRLYIAFKEKTLYATAAGAYK